MKKRITKKQLEIMKILWSSDKPLIASEILKRNDSLNINTVQACLRALVNKQFIKVADIVYSGTVLTRSYTPLVSREDFLETACQDIIGKAKVSSLIASLIDTETNLSELEELEKLIEQKKEELKSGEK
ncbi:BlaI/MecI/CopY family transcriptional regulator [Mordavella massiliensis]|uniref:BlaI/MecI/CopY family transcriptional regulator n=1 Tax=Mordavella massiliensis TaxID=1871024 RepID=A0A939BCM0_9CLOT|nr:BlaI/MecI/CopY family transcriptional regulator [Mordavella massiliensis]MBM6826992.1 BlaI/MecI/CopY family transcriptional regulator [Mordavella massiliensis]